MNYCELKWDRRCPECGTEIIYTTKSGWEKAEANKSKCRACCNNKPDYIKLFNRFKKSAEMREKEFTLTPEYIRGLLDGSGYRCSLSGNTLDYQSISIDRIDSSLGYIPSNVAIVAKVVNQMKYTYPVESFIDYCSKIHKHQIHLNQC